jgi:hypothetical protein
MVVPGEFIRQSDIQSFCHELAVISAIVISKRDFPMMLGGSGFALQAGISSTPLQDFSQNIP